MRLRFHPCCGARLDRWLKLLLAFDIIGSAIVIQSFVMALCLITAYKYKWLTNPGFSDEALSFHVATVVVFLVFVAADLLLDVWLWLLVSEKDWRKCRVWFLIKLVLEVCDAIGFVVEVCSGQHTAVYIIGMSFDTMFTAYILWVLYAFITQSRGDTNQVSSDGDKVILYTANGEPSSNIV